MVAVGGVCIVGREGGGLVDFYVGEDEEGLFEEEVARGDEEDGGGGSRRGKGVGDVVCGEVVFDVEVSAEEAGLVEAELVGAGEVLAGGDVDLRGVETVVLVVDSENGAFGVGGLVGGADE